MKEILEKEKKLEKAEGDSETIAKLKNKLSN